MVELRLGRLDEGAVEQPLEGVAGDRAGVEVEKREIAHQHFGRIAEIEEVTRAPAGLCGFEIERQSPFAGKGRPLVAQDAADMLDLDHRMGGVFDTEVVGRIDDDANRQPIDEGGGEWLDLFQNDAHRRSPRTSRPQQ
jgi:hypothetical protein